MEYHVGQELFCITTEQIKSAYQHLTVNFPEPGKIYRIRKICRFKADPQPFVLLHGIKNVPFAAGHEICFPVRWFADPNQVNISAIENYLRLFKSKN